MIQAVETKRETIPQPPEKGRGILDGAREYLAHVRMFSRNARLYLLGVFLLELGFTFFSLLLNLYMKELGFGEGNIGFVNSSRAIGTSLMAIPAALILARMQLRPILIAAGVAFAVFGMCIATAEQLRFLILFQILAGMSYTFNRVAAGPFYMRNSTPTERTHLFSASFGVIILAGMVGSLVAGRLVPIMTATVGRAVTGYQYTLYIGAALGLLALVPFSILRATGKSDEERRIRISLAQLRQRGVFYFKISFANFLIGIGAGLIIPFLNLYFRSRFGLSTATIGQYFFWTELSMLVGTLAGPLLAKRFGLVRTIVITQLASIPFMFTLAYTYNVTVAFYAYVIRAGLMNLGSPIATNFGMEMSDQSERGLVNALLMVSWTFSWMLSAALGGHLIEKYGYTMTFNITMVMYVLSTFFYFWAFRGVEKRSGDRAGWNMAEGEAA